MLFKIRSRETYLCHLVICSIAAPRKRAVLLHAYFMLNKVAPLSRPLEGTERESVDIYSPTPQNTSSLHNKTENNGVYILDNDAYAVRYHMDMKSSFFNR